MNTHTAHTRHTFHAADTHFTQKVPSASPHTPACTTTHTPHTHLWHTMAHLHTAEGWLHTHPMPAVLGLLLPVCGSHHWRHATCLHTHTTHPATTHTHTHGTDTLHGPLRRTTRTAGFHTPALCVMRAHAHTHAAHCRTRLPLPAAFAPFARACGVHCGCLSLHALHRAPHARAGIHTAGSCAAAYTPHLRTRDHRAFCAHHTTRCRTLSPRTGSRTVSSRAYLRAYCYTFLYRCYTAPALRAPLLPTTTCTSCTPLCTLWTAHTHTHTHTPSLLSHLVCDVCTTPLHAAPPVTTCTACLRAAPHMPARTALSLLHPMLPYAIDTTPFAVPPPHPLPLPCPPTPHTLPLPLHFPRCPQPRLGRTGQGRPCLQATDMVLPLPTPPTPLTPTPALPQDMDMKADRRRAACRAVPPHLDGRTTTTVDLPSRRRYSGFPFLDAPTPTPPPYAVGRA